MRRDGPRSGPGLWRVASSLMWPYRELYRAYEPSPATWDRVEVPRGRRAGPLRARRATSDEAHGATSGPLLRGLSFELLVFPSAVGIRVRLPATLQSLNRLFTAGGSGWGVASNGPA